MPRLITEPASIRAAGSKGKLIKEYVGRVNSATEDISIAKMASPEGWEEPGQKPEFDEYTLVLNGILRVTTPTEIIDVKAGEAIIAEYGQWVRYSTPHPGGAEYISVCTPAFSDEIVNRDNED